MKKILAFILVCILLPGVFAEGLLPSTKQIFGEIMPSVQYAINRKPSREYAKDGALIQEYEGFKDEDYECFSRYLGKWNCEVIDIKREENTAILLIAKDDVSIRFVYERDKAIVRVYYPNGTTRVEAHRTYMEMGRSVLPSLDDVFGVKLHSPSTVWGRLPGDYNSQTGWRTYYNVSTRDYEIYGAYLADNGYSVLSYQILGAEDYNKYLSISIGFEDDALLEVVYSLQLQTFMILYSDQGYVEEKEGHEETTNESILPPADLLIVSMPTPSIILNRKPNYDYNQDGHHVLVYCYVTENDFDLVSKMFLKYNCELIDWKSDDNSITALIGKDGEPLALYYELSNQLLYIWGWENSVSMDISVDLSLITDVGEALYFGHYEQDNDEANGKEPIEWIILDKKEDGTLLLMSKYVLDASVYNQKLADMSWEASDVRQWLNTEFYCLAFNPEEQQRILLTSTENASDPTSGTIEGNSVEDHVFLLSTDEAGQYLTDEAICVCYPTDYAISKGALRMSSTGWNNNTYRSCRWWLRSIGYTQSCAAYVDVTGKVSHKGDKLYLLLGIRPIIWLSPEENACS